VTRRVLGVDACPAGWVVVELLDGRVHDVRVVPSLASLDLAGVRVAAIDIPIGAVDGPREADTAARAVLPGRASSVFSAPPRSVLDAWRAGEVTDHAAASALARRVAGAGLSQQAWRLVPRIVEAEDLVRDATDAGAVLEVHPEVAFAVVAGAPLPSKRTWAGVQARVATLARLGVRLPDRFDGDTGAAPHDVLDAAICAWVADGVDDGLRALPPSTRQRELGRPTVIHAREPGLRGS
jgi:predicted RNase H-like nuclease